MTSITAIIINRNRLEHFTSLVKWMKNLSGIGRIIVADNASAYPPLLSYYATNPLGLEIIRLQENLGPHKSVPEVVRRLGLTDQLIVTDPDLVPCEDMPGDLLQKLQQLMSKYPGVHKIGPGLKIDDLPDCYPFRDQVIRHEKHLLRRVLPEGARMSLIDTTFALYACPDAFGVWSHPAIRLNAPYLLRHPDWYIDPGNLSDEYRWYLENSTEAASYGYMLKQWMHARKLEWRRK